MLDLHWQLFVSLVDEIEEISHYIELCEDNYKTYSIALTRILLSASSEVDVVAKLLCKKLYDKKCGTIGEYKDVLTADTMELCNIEVSIPRHGLSFIPWKGWANSGNPAWWRAYNEVKHQRDKSYTLANLENCLNAVSGLCVLVSYLNDEFVQNRLKIKRPFLFLDNKYRCKSCKALTTSPYKLPEIKK